MNRFTPIALALACAFVPALASAAAPSIATSANTVDGLLPAAVEVLRQKVLVQCGLGEATDRLPWYFHFEFGRALLEAGDARRAVTQLAQSVDINPVPRADKRLYGMWFTDYLPYFQLADAHARLENWPCAAHALELSRSSGETESGRLDPQRVRAVEEAIGLHGDALGACQMKDVLDPRYADAGFRG